MPNHLMSNKKNIWLRFLFRADHLFNRIYSADYNPLYQSGTLAILFLSIASVTGLYLIFFYKISAPYESVLAIQEDVFWGQWMRSVHRYASDLAALSILFHVVRVALQKRFDGPRFFVWVTGIFFTSFVFLCGWTGLIMVWDVQAQALVVSLARLLDVLPIFIEPIELSLISNESQPKSFFFMLLFLHVSLPLGLLFAYWLHVSRLARAAFLPHKKLSLAALLVVIVAALLWAYPLDPAALIYKQTESLRLDLFYSYFLLPGLNQPAWLLFLEIFIVPVLLLLIPVLFKSAVLKKPSVVHEKSCTGCTSCYQDCPYEAINMVPRSIGSGSEFVAHVNPDLCVSCGICAASCDPMGVGPPGRTGRDQLKAVELFLKDKQADYQKPVIISCEQSWNPHFNQSVSPYIHLVTCSGNVHTSVVEYLIRCGFKGVMIFTCPKRNCFNREGPLRLHQRVFEGHESALKDQVDRNRIKIVEIDLFDSQKVRDTYEQFVFELNQKNNLKGEAEVKLDLDCQKIPDSLS